MVRPYVPPAQSSLVTRTCSSNGQRAEPPEDAGNPAAAQAVLRSVVAKTFQRGHHGGIALWCRRKVRHELHKSLQFRILGRCAIVANRNARWKRNKKVAVSVVMLCSPNRGTLEGARHHGL